MMALRIVKDICSVRFLKHVLPVFISIIIGAIPSSILAMDVLFGTGEPGTFSYFTGRTICRVINRHASDINCKVVPAPNDMHNLTNLQGGSLDVGLIDSRLLHDAVNKTSHFKFLDIQYDNLSALVPLYDIATTLLVRHDSKITSLEAVKGKRINAGAPGSIQHLAVDTIMKAKGWTNDDFSLVAELSTSQAQDTMAFCHGSIQAMVHIGVHPDPSLEQLVTRCKAGLVNMDDSDIVTLINTHPAYYKIEIPAETYPSQAHVLTTFGTKGVLVVSRDLDDQTVCLIMDTIFRNSKRLQNAHPALSPLTMADVPGHVAGIPLHPGAERCISDHTR